MRIQYETELYHHGIKGQKWGIRRYQKPDGTVTELGRTRYALGATKYLNDMDTERARAAKSERKLAKKDAKASARLDKEIDRINKAADKAGDNEAKKAQLREQLHKSVSKYNKVGDKYAEAMNKREYMEKQIDAQVKQLGKDGFTVASQSSKRPTATNKDLIISAFVFGVPGVVLTELATLEEGTAYRVY